MKRSSTSNCFKSIGNSPSRKKTKGPFTARGNGRLSSTSYEWKNNKSREASEDFDAKLLKWPSLDSEDSASENLPIKRLRGQRNSSNRNFIDYDSKKDISSDSIALHPKKLSELRYLMRNSMQLIDRTKVLLLTGPSGSGKSTAVRLLSRELGIEYFEFDGNEETTCTTSSDLSEEKNFSSLKEFTRFLENTQHHTLKQNASKHRLVLFDQLPISFYRNSQLFHDHLRNIVRSCHRCLLIFAFSNVDSCWELNPMRIFPKKLIDSLHIAHIKFNPVSNTLMSKLVRSLSSCSSNGKVDQNFVRQVVDYSDGDIRRALNFMHFTLSTFSSSAAKTDLQNLDHFHFLGKIMYSKRADRSTAEWDRCEKKLSKRANQKFGRPFPPKDDVNALILRSYYLAGSSLLGYVFEHEPNFAPTINSIKRVACRAAECDAFFNSSSFSELSDGYTLEATIRTTIFNNYSSTPFPRQRAGKLYEFTKPRFKAIQEQCKDTNQLIAELNPQGRCTNMKTLILPTMLQTRSTCDNLRQADLLNRLSFGARKSFVLQPVATTSNPSQSSDYNNYDIVQGQTPSNSSACSPLSQYIGSISSSGDFGDGFNYDVDE